MNTLEAIFFCPIFKKLGQNIHLHESLNEFENGSYEVINSVTRSNFEKNLAKLTPIPAQRKVELELIEREAIADFYGNMAELGKAVGLLHLGDHLGWRVLVLIHNKGTIRKYEAILGITVREFFPEEGSASYRSVGLSAAKKVKNFWKVVSGETKVANKTEITKGG